MRPPAECASGSARRSELATLRSSLDRLQSLRLLRPFTDTEAVDHGRWCAREAEILAGTGTGTGPVPGADGQGLSSLYAPGAGAHHHRMQRPVECDGVVIVHRDRSATCTDTRCSQPPTETRALIGCHSWFVPCTESLLDGCPRCESADELA
jgi:hypothetical protein